MTSQNIFHAQFTLDLKHYRDNNNFLRINEVETNDNRLNILAQPKEYEFIDYKINPTWMGSSEYWTMNVTRDNGKTFKVEKQLLLFGSYFFMSEERVRHSRTA